MAITTITSTKNGKGSIDYVLKGRTEDNKNPAERSLAVRGHNLDPTRAKEQMSAVWRNFGKDDGNTIQTYRIIQSFRETDFNKDNYEDIEKANEIGLALAEKLYPNRQALIVTQADGDGGKVHNHIIVNSVEPVTGKSLRGAETSWEKTISKANDEVLKEHEIKTLERDTLRDIAYSQSELSIITDKTKSWKNTIRDAVEDSISDNRITSIDDLKDMLENDYDIQLTLRGKTITYSGTFNTSKDEENPKFVERKVRATKLGKNYTLEGLTHAFRENQIERESEFERALKLSRIKAIEPIRNVAAEKFDQSDEGRIGELEGSDIEFKSTHRHNVTDKSESRSDESSTTRTNTNKSTLAETNAEVTKHLRAIQEQKRKLREQEEQRELERIEQQNQRAERERKDAERASIRKQNRQKRSRDNGIER